MRRILGSMLVAAGIIGLGVGLIDWRSWFDTQPTPSAEVQRPSSPQDGAAQQLANPPPPIEEPVPNRAPTIRAEPPEEPAAPQLSRSVPSNGDPSPGPSFEDAEMVDIEIDPAGLEVAESDTQAIFKVRLAAPSVRPIVVVYATLDSTATAESDFSPRRGTLTFDPGQTEAEIVVPIIDDGDSEGAEQIEILATADPTVARLSVRRLTVTIRDND